MNTLKNLGKKLQLVRFLKEEDGAGVVEVILILVVIIGLVLIFKEQLSDLVDKIFSKIQRNANSV
ncbi:MAG: Flp1 family type IVb pilin [Lachnospiraceae bacterium]|nr:Flp1 family type IVb pilin [Lachnospiraceae bacterium]